MLTDHGFNCIKLADEWQGADFLAYHKGGVETLRVQLKARLEIHRKYEGRGLHVAFRLCGVWHILEHDLLIQICGEKTPRLSSKSWVEHGWYTSVKPGRP